MRIIPIGRATPPQASRCGNDRGEDSGEVKKLDLPLARCSPRWRHRRSGRWS